MEKYFKYIEQPKFIDWVFSPTKESDQYWFKYITEHPEDKALILKLKQAISTFSSKKKVLSYDQKVALLQRIQQSVASESKKKKIRKIYLQSVKYAAVAILFFVAGTLWDIYYDKEDDLGNFNLTAGFTPSENTQVILPNGEQINVKAPDSKVQHTKSGNVIIDKDTINTIKNKSQASELVQIIVPFGKKSRVSLPDGSVVDLNAGSRLVYPSLFDGKKREVKLIGEAFFDVAKNDRAPFLVRTSKLSVEVKGTQFNVSAYPFDRTTETVLAEGSVRIVLNNKKIFGKDILLQPGQMASYNNKTGESKIVAVDIENHILWKDGLLKFRDIDLNRLVKKLERFYNVRIGFKDPLTGMMVVSGKLDLNADMVDVLENLAVTASSKIEKMDEKNYIIGK